MNEFKRLDDWVKALFEPGARFDVSLAGIAGRLRLSEGWVNVRDALPDHLFYFVVEGVFEARLNNETRRINAGELLWAGQGTSIRFRLPPGEKLVIWRFRLDARGAGGALLAPPRPFWHLAPARNCETWMEQIVDEASYPGTHGERRQRALLACLFIEIARLAEGASNQAGSLTRAQRETIARYFAEHAARWPTPADLAAAAELSPDYFARCFRRTYGVPPRRWLVEERQRLAALRLLESTQNISQIAASLGYADVFLFSRQFKAVFGASPTQYRQSHGAVGHLGL